MIQDSTAKGTGHTKAATCVCGVAMLSKSDGAIVVNSPCTGFVTIVTTDVALELHSDGRGSISIVSALGVWSSTEKVTTGSLTPLATGSSSVVGDGATVTFSSTIASET